MVELRAKTEIGERVRKRGNRLVERTSECEGSERMWEEIDWLVEICKGEVSERGRKRGDGMIKTHSES